MADQFSVSRKEMRQLQKFYKTAPKAFQRVSAEVLNSMAFGTRVDVLKVINRTMTVRSPGLVRKLNLVEKAKPNQPINNQSSRVGSIDADRHDGWEAVQAGKPTSTRISVFTDTGRGGRFSGRAKAGAKFKRAAHTGPQDYGLPEGMGQDQAVMYMQKISADSKRRRKSWYLPVRYKGMPAGIYQFFGGKVKRQVFSISTRQKRKPSLFGASIRKLSTPQQRFNPDRINWMDKAVNEAVTEDAIRRWWIRNMDIHLERTLKKAGLK